jgi:hypothetical protein
VRTFNEFRKKRNVGGLRTRGDDHRP